MDESQIGRKVLTIMHHELSYIKDYLNVFLLWLLYDADLIYTFRVYTKPTSNYYSSSFL